MSQMSERFARTKFDRSSTNKRGSSTGSSPKIAEILVLLAMGVLLDFEFDFGGIVGF
jgi:hypothetical protein